MHPQGVVLNLFGSVRPERREGQRSKGRLVSSSRRLVVSFRRVRRFVSSRSSFRFRFRFVGREERGGGKKGGTQDELNQRGPKRPCEDALKSNEGVKL